MRRFFTNWWTISITIVVLLILMFTFGLPLVVGFLRPLWVRLTIGGLIVVVWALLAFLRARKAKRANDAIAEELLAPSAGDQESAALTARMAEAVAALKSSSGKRRDYLYSRPWYVIIGPPGAGKTTALLNSGLRFPFADQSFKGVGGTRNLDFWFADEAALVDTAGRYTSQDSDASVDAQGWQSFLGLLKKHRPLQPINGILVAIGLDELIRADRAAIDAHAAAVRRRLTELRRTLEVAAPVYVLLTKADLLAGFVEFYDDLDVEGRRAVLGATLPYSAARPDMPALANAFDSMTQALADRQAKRLFEEVDQNRRSLILGFPAQLGSLRARLMRFLDGAFVAGDQPGGVLRGFYLTSGVQEGAPLDRILSGMADVYDQSSSTTNQGSGRTYFLNRLLSEVVFAEAGLVQTDPAARARQRSQLIGGLTAVGAAAALTLVAWGVSFFSNRSFQSDLLASSQQVQTLARETGLDMVEVRSTDPDLEQALSTLRALRNLPQGYAARAAGAPGWSMTFGLYQTSHSDSAVEAYHDGLRRILLPRILLRLETFMSENGSNALAVYEPLKVYLMLGGLGPMDQGTVKAWVQSDWAGQAYPGADQASVRNELAQHLSAMLEDPNLAAAWAGRKAPLDGTAIASARAALQTLSLADRAYAIMKQKASASGGADWEAAAILASGDAQAFANGEAVMALRVPYFFTRPGFEKAYQLGLATVQADLRKDLWVMGDDAGTEGVKEQIAGIRPGVAGAYAREYIAAWDNVISTMQPGAYFSDKAA
jgi:type VI secretion system protein ImpL